MFCGSRISDFQVDLVRIMNQRVELGLKLELVHFEGSQRGKKTRIGS